MLDSCSNRQKKATVWVETTAPRLMFLEEALKQGVLDGVTFREPIPFYCFFLIKGERGSRFATPPSYIGNEKLESPDKRPKGAMSY